MKALLISSLISMLGSILEQEARANTDSLVLMSENYCLKPDGDHRMTWQKAERGVFTLIAPEEFPGLRILGSQGDTLRAFRRYDGDGETRILTAASWVQAPDDGRSHFRYCWVSRTGEKIEDVKRDLRQHLGGRHFRAEETFVYAWIPRPDGTNEFIPRRIYMRRHLTLAREQGMRQVTARQYGDSVFIGYSSPRDEATYRDFDWSGPEPVPKPK